jgi:hypothetical protein
MINFYNKMLKMYVFGTFEISTGTLTVRTENFAGFI